MTESRDRGIAHIERELLNRGLAAAGEAVVLVGSRPLIVRGRTNFLKVHRLNKDWVSGLRCCQKETTPDTRTTRQIQPFGGAQGEPSERGR